MFDKSIDLTWHGEEYNLLVKYKTIRKLYDRANIGLIATQLSDENLRNAINYTDVAGIVCIALNDAGARVNEQEVYAGIFGGVDDVNIVDILGMLNIILAACFPEVKKKPITLKGPPKK
jgi:hypothetical protein